MIRLIILVLKGSCCVTCSLLLKVWALVCQMWVFLVLGQGYKDPSTLRQPYVLKYIMHEINKPPIRGCALQWQPGVCTDSGASIKCSALSGASTCTLSARTFSNSEQVSDARICYHFVVLILFDLDILK